eukprot:gene31926-37621_t
MHTTARALSLYNGVQVDPTRQCALDSFASFDDHNTGFLDVNVVRSILCTGGDPLSVEESEAITCELAAMSDHGRISIEKIVDFLYGGPETLKAPSHHTNDGAVSVTRGEQLWPQAP